MIFAEEPEPPIIPPTPHLPENQIKPTTKDVYELLRHLHDKIGRLEEKFESVKNLNINLENTINELKKEIKELQTLFNGTQNMVSRIHEDILHTTPHTPLKFSAGMDVEPTPKPSTSQQMARVQTPPPLGCTRDVKPLGSTFTPGAPPPRTLLPSGTAGSSFQGYGTTTQVPKVKEPEAFDGTRGKEAEHWGMRTVVWAQNIAPSFPDKQALVLQVLANTKGKAADWAGPHIAHIMKQELGAMRNFGEFMIAFEKAFQDPDIKRASTYKIVELKQMTDIEAYITDFENLSSELGWNEEALQATFKKGIHWKMKETLAQMYPQPALFEDYKQHACHIDGVCQENEES